MPVTIIDGKNCNQTIAEIFKVQSMAQMYDSTNVDWDTPPFVQIGNLYVSLTITGDGSWGYIVKKNPGKSFKVYTGRHGNVINPIGADGRLPKEEEANSPDDPTDPKLDRAAATKLGSHVGVVDVRADDFRTLAGLKGKIAADLAGSSVILAWCYGLFTFVASEKVGHGEDVSSRSHVAYDMWSEAVTAKVKTIVLRDFAWVP